VGVGTGVGVGDEEDDGEAGGWLVVSSLPVAGTWPVASVGPHAVSADSRTIEIHAATAELVPGPLVMVDPSQRLVTQRHPVVTVC
jgi:hypothetical protein